NAMPLFTAGGGVDIHYKGFRLSTFFHGRFGQKVVNKVRMGTENMRGTSNQSTAVLGRWRNEGDASMIPRALYGEGYNYLGSDRFVEDASFVRLKMVSLRYSLPKSLIERFGVTRFDVFATLQYVYTWTKYFGQDPEVSLFCDVFIVSHVNFNTNWTRQ